jgi:hypothetical protein
VARERLTDAEILAQISAARARGARAQRTEPHAASARYDRATRTLVVMLTSGAGVIVPVDRVPRLDGAAGEQRPAARRGPSTRAARRRTAQALTARTSPMAKEGSFPVETVVEGRTVRGMYTVTARARPES